MDIETMFAGMEKAQNSGSGVYFGEGRYLLRTKLIKVNNGFNGRYFIAELEVVESTCADDPKGSTRTFMVNLDPKNTYAFGDIKSFFMALACDADPKRAGDPTTNPQLHAQATKCAKIACDAEYAKSQGADPDTFVGLPVRLETVKKDKKKSEGKFTNHFWQPASATASAATTQAA